MSFEPGLVVQLKSGGPAMTVVTVDAENVQCVYYAEVSDEVRTATIAAIALVVIAPEDEDEDEEEGED